ncbi:MAG: insulinase family protein [Lachnospiraceae bacterium]|nr:insulinase family protein [Lachnospiraceae bacterium]
MHSAYELIRKEQLTDINSEGYVLRHKKSGAHISFIKNDDDNKVFYIGFRTPPLDSTGVPHIVEHTVLCGSDKYPLKDPFVELVKGSLNTFLNAITYPDKTVYPIASCNDKDFKNLMDVYLDAVLHPNIYHDPEIFMQEGWHYELESEEDELTINGVVYNEMKGAFSSPDDVVNREMLNSLFPDNAYHYESGGDPQVIPELTYEDFIGFHQRYYHPCNSYIYLYGNIDMEERLDYLDREYLSKYDAIDLDSHIEKQEAFDTVRMVDATYPISAGEDEKDGTYLAYSVAVGDALDQELYQAFDVLEYALLSAPGAPVKTALLEKGIGKDIMGSYDTGMLQPMFSVVAKGANPEDKQRFMNTVLAVLKEQSTNGIDKKALLAGINASQFSFREADFGSFPKGLIFGLNCLDSWLYDVDEPFTHLYGIRVLDGLKKKVETDYFEKLIDKYLLRNTHASLLMVSPEKGLASRQDEKLKEELRKKKMSMSQQEREQLIQQTKLLKQHQQEPSTKEQLECLPMLTRQDLKREARPLDLEEKQIADITVLHHNVFTSGIHYLNLVFDVSEIAQEDWGYLSLMTRMLGLVDTEEFTYGQLANEINIHTGGISASLGVYARENNGYRFTCEVRGKFLYENVKQATHLMEEMMLHSHFEDENRIREVIALQKSRLEMRMNSAGNAIAASRAMAGFSVPAKISEMTSGIAYYRFLKDLEDNYEDRKSLIQEKCQSLLRQVFRVQHLLVSTTGDEVALHQVEEYLPRLKDKLFTTAFTPVENHIVLEPKKEAFADASQVQYVCRAGNFAKAGYQKTGILNILKVILSYDYFWINIRVKGGAYGCRSVFSRNGDTYFVSYRDPNLEKTNQVFAETADYLEDFAVDERDMTKYIIGTISEMDTPLTPSQRGTRALSAYLQGITFEEIQRTRDQVIDATVEDIRAMADLVRETMDQGYFCVVGNEDVLRESPELFDSLENLF